MYEAIILNAISDTMSCAKCPCPCEARENSSKANCVLQWSEILSKINPSTDWREARYEAFGISQNSR